MSNLEKKKLTFYRFSCANRHRCEAADGFNHKLNSWSHAEWLAAASGELGEVAHVIKSILRQRDGLISSTDSAEKLNQRLGEEIADTVIYLDMLAQSAGIDLGKAITKKFNKKSKEIGSNELL